MIDFKHFEVWFVTGSQHLYGPEALRKVDEDSKAVVAGLSSSSHIPVNVVFKPVLTTPDAILNLCREANNAQNCVGIVAWMHTFSPAKMWIAGLKALNKPLLDLHTQFGRDIPWGEIDMNFMNLNQTAHGGREFGFITARMKKPRKVVVGFWQDETVQKKIGVWSRVAVAWADSQGMKIARFGDNMRSVAVTEGDKVEAEMRFGFAVNGYGLGDLVSVMRTVTEPEIESLLGTYDNDYDLVASLRRGGEKRKSLYEAARIELGIRKFLNEGNFKAFTTTFENLHGLEQLPGLSVQRLMSDGYGFGAEGDWKTAALLRLMKTMSAGLAGGTSFMEDYTYHLDPSRKQVLGAHMLEICQSIASHKPKLEIHPLSIGGKADPPRLVFNVPAGAAINATLVDMGNRFRLIVNKVETIPPEKPLPKLPVARALWIPKPDFETGVEAWILAGGAHHTVFSQSVTTEYLEDFAEIAGIELMTIDERTTLSEFKKELRWNELYYRLSS
ncbi:MAG TPA: L-arabinose isomerase [Bacteroidota bacterium]|nr:L-arabinose isomerase [Bacteroidota bacterium]